MVIHGTLVFLLAAATAWGVTGALIPLMRRRGVLDVPNERSSHDAPRPRGGGLGILAGMAVGAAGAAALGVPLPGPALLLGAAIVALVGFLDDHGGGLSPLLRLLLQTAAAGIVVWAAGGLPRLPFPAPLDASLGWLGVPLALVWIVGVTNLYNFLDGIDGYAGAQGVVGGLGVAALSFVYPSLALGFILAGACVGFLFHNWHPARIFMGDVGAYTLGFVLAALPFELDAADRPGVVFAVALCLWFFLSDGAFTVLRRLFHGERIWTAHRSHLYQRLVQTGLRHSQVVAAVGAAATVVAALGVATVYAASTAVAWGVLLGAVAAFGGYYQITTRRETHHVGVR